MKKDPIVDALGKAGLELEKKPDVHPVTQMLAGGLGGIAGGHIGAMVGLGELGKALASLAGAVVGHIAATYDVRFADRHDPDRPRSPMAWSDRR